LQSVVTQSEGKGKKTRVGSEKFRGGKGAPAGQTMISKRYPHEKESFERGKKRKKTAVRDLGRETKKIGVKHGPKKGVLTYTCC